MSGPLPPDDGGGQLQKMAVVLKNMDPGRDFPPELGS